MDERSQELFDIVAERLGVSPVQVNTPRGRHFYFNNPHNIRYNFKSLPIDFKTGFNSYVAGPYSKRLDGGFYEPEKGLLGVDTLPTIEGPLNGPLSGSGKVFEPNRNGYLTKFAKDHVLYVDSLEELAENLRYERDNRCDAGSHPVTDSDILAKAEWAWKLRLTGNVWGGEQMLNFKASSIQALVTNPDGGIEAFALFSILKKLHPFKGKTFSLNFEGMKEAGHITFGKPAFRKAIKLLISRGHLQKTANYSVGNRGNQYSLGLP